MGKVLALRSKFDFGESTPTAPWRPSLMALLSCTRTLLPRLP
jgi:hypothetical protein